MAVEGCQGPEFCDVLAVWRRQESVFGSCGQVKCLILLAAVDEASAGVLCSIEKVVHCLLREGIPWVDVTHDAGLHDCELQLVEVG